MQQRRERYICKYSIVISDRCLDSLKSIFSEKQREIIRYWLYSIPAFFFRNSLANLAQLYGTDKYEHGYTSIYQKHLLPLKYNKLRILEIGIGGGSNTKYGGNSLKMWAKFFPNAEILGIDMYNKSLIDYRRIKTYQGNQSDENFLSQFQHLDLIIDDGSHINKDVIRSFEILLPRLNKGGYYFVEDIQVSGSYPYHSKDFPNTLDYFRQLKNSNKEIHIELLDKIILIRKL